MLLLSGCQGTSLCLLDRCPQSPESEALAGAKAAPALEARYGGVIRDADVEARLERVGRRVTQATPVLSGIYHYRLLDTDRLNACSLPGGRVYLTRGLYERLTSDDQVAAVIAHEAAHIAAKDHFKPRCGCTDDAVNREILADVHGVVYLQHAGMDPRAMIEVVKLISEVQPAGWSDTRVQALTRQLDRADKCRALAQR